MTPIIIAHSYPPRPPSFLLITRIRINDLPSPDKRRPETISVTVKASSSGVRESAAAVKREKRRGFTVNGDRLRDEDT